MNAPRNGEAPADRSKDEDDGLLDRRSVHVSIGILVIGILAIAVFAFQANTSGAFASVIAFGVAIAGASLLVGGLIGFLFGIPRRLQREDAEPAKDDQRSEPGEETSRRALYSGNTNLEQISDWLTKILVGVGLTQLGEIGNILAGIGRAAAKGMGGAAASDTFAIAIVVYFTVSGFLLGYLWTRLYLGRALTAAERAYSLKKQLTKFEQQSYADARALRLVERQLSGEAPEPTQAELDATIKAASRATCAHIFYRAQLQRWRNWREASTKPIMERTIPIFRALVASDLERRFHANYAQLGYALKDQQEPDWKAAEENLSVAIAIRGDDESSDWRSYEFNRAICRIMLDPAFAEGKPSSAEARQAILSDIARGVEDEWVRDWAKNQPDIAKWLGLNGLTLDGIAGLG